MASSSKVSLVLEGKDNVSKTLEKTQKQLKSFTDKGKGVGAVSEKFRQLQESSKTYGSKIKEIKKLMEELQQTGAKTSAEGQRMWNEMSKAAKEYDKNLRDIRTSTSSIDGPDVKGGGLDLKSLSGLADKAGLGGITKSLGGLAAMANPATVAVAAVGGTMIAAGKKAADFEVHLDSLQALTGLTAEQMKGVSATALEMSKKFGMSAGDIVDSMGLIGSQAPILLKDADALAFVTDAAMTLSQAGSIAATEAGAAITTVVNQMGVLPSEAMNIANVLAAAEKQGAASIAYLNTAFEKAGTQAKGAGMSYTELAAMIESVAPKFSSADVAGTQLNATLLRLSMGADEFNPAVVGMQAALDNLSNAQLSNAELAKMVGKGNVTMVKAMIDAKDSFASFSQTLTGTNSAVDSWLTKSDNMAGTVAQLKSYWDAFLITLGQSGLLKGIADDIGVVMKILGEVVDILSSVIEAFGEFGGEGGDNVNLVAKYLETLQNVIRGVGEVLEFIVRLAAKVFNTLKDVAAGAANWIGEKWENLKKAIGDVAFVKVVINAFNKVLDAAANMVKAIQKYWNKLKEFLGLKTEAVVDVKVKHTDADMPKATPTDSVGATPTAEGSGASRTKSKSAARTIDYTVAVDDNSLDMAEKKLQAFAAKKKTINVDDTEALARCDEEIQKWTREVARRKAAVNVTLSVDDKSLDYAEKRLSELSQQAKSVDVGDADAVRALNEEIQKWTKEVARRKAVVSVTAATDDKSLDYAEKRLSELNQQAKSVDVDDSDAVRALNEEIKKWEKAVADRKAALGIEPKVEEGSLAYIQKLIKDKEDEIELAIKTDIDPESYRRMQSELDALKNQETEKKVEIGATDWADVKRQALADANSQSEQLRSDYELNLIGREDVEEKIAAINAKLAELGLQEIDLHVSDDGTLRTAAEELDAYVEKMSGTAEQIGQLGSAFSAMGDAVGGTGGKVMEFAGQTLSAVSEIIPKIVALIGAKQAEAMASGVASGAALPFPANLAAMASVLATVVSLFATIPKSFASGGIVPGSSYAGDSVLVRANSGEMILNKSEQSSLFRLLKNGNGGGLNAGNVEFKISGSTLKGVLKNYDKTIGRL